MNLKNLWPFSSAKSKPRPAADEARHSPPLAAKIVQDRQQIERFCSTLITAKIPIYAHNDLYQGQKPIFMVGMSDNAVILEIPATTSPALSGAVNRINLTTVIPGGAALFTLENFRKTTQRFARADRPELVVRSQSRADFRVSGKLDARQLAWLQLNGSTRPLPLHDVSETGLGLLHAQPLPVNARGYTGGVLILEGAKLTIPGLIPVRKSAAGGGFWQYGLHMQGLLESDLRTIRRWMQQAQTRQLSR